jgi:uncharacterized protein YegL
MRGSAGARSSQGLQRAIARILIALIALPPQAIGGVTSGGTSRSDISVRHLRTVRSSGRVVNTNPPVGLTRGVGREGQRNVLASAPLAAPATQRMSDQHVPALHPLPGLGSTKEKTPPGPACPHPSPTPTPTPKPTPTPTPAPTPAPCASSPVKAHILLVVGAGTANKADGLVVSRLEALGYGVSVETEREARATQRPLPDLVLISSSVSPSSVDPAFRALAVPLVTWEPALFQGLGLTRKPGKTMPAADRLKIVNADHALAAGLSATPFVTTGATSLSGGTPEGSAVRVAGFLGGGSSRDSDRDMESATSAPSCSGPSGEAAVFAYDRGKMMVGMAAPARRVALFLNDDTATHLNTNGWSLFDAAVAWALSSEALFVVGPPSLTKGDAALAAFFERLGYALTTRMDEAVRDSDALGKRFVFLSDTVRPSTTRDRLRDVAVPLIASQPELFGDLGLTGHAERVDSGEASNQTAITIVDETSPLAAGLRGDVRVLLQPFAIGWGRPSSEGQTVAEVPGSPARAAVFAYERGAQMASKVAPERRVGLFLLKDAPDRLSSDGWLMLRAAVAWATHGVQEVSCTRPLDVMLVLDRSASMRGSRLQDAKGASQRFVQGLHLDRDRVGLVSFADDARIDHQLTSDGGAVVSAIETLDAGGGTNMTEALSVAAQAVKAEQASAATPVIVVLTDGRTGSGDAFRAAQQARAAGIRIITIGVGNQIDEAELRLIASSPVDFYAVPSSADLGWIYLLIAATLCSRENEPPSVDAGPDQTLSLPTSAASLHATVTDDGLPACGSLNVQWTDVSGPGAVIFSTPTAADTNVQFPAAGDYVLRLTASDGEKSASDEITVHVKNTNSPPVVNAGPDLTLTWPTTTATLGGTSSDDGVPGPLSSIWTVVTPACAGHVFFTDAASAVTTVTIDTPGSCTLRLTASDTQLQASDEMVLTSVRPNLPPIVSAGLPQTTTLPVDSVTLQGSVVDDGLPIPPGVPSVLWTGPPEVAFANPMAPVTQATFSQPGTYLLTLTASDSVLVSSATTSVTVQRPNQPPTVDAGRAQTITLPTNEVTLAGSTSDDGIPNPPGQITLSWAQIGGAGTVTFSDATSATTTAQFSAPGIYVLRLTASDSQLSASSDVTITVSNVNQPPLVNAGSNRAVNLPPDGGPAVVSLTGTTSDDGLPDPPTMVTTQWSQQSGPVPATIEDVAQAVTSASFDTPGTYVLQLAASDSALSAIDAVSITVSPAGPQNQPPVLDAGPNQTITLPTNTVSLNGAASDDGLPTPPGALTISWTQTSGPAGVSFADPHAASTHATFPGVGTYGLQLSATDGELSSAATVIVTVYPVGFGNQAPRVSAGPNRTITLPTNAVTLAGSASDDGLPNPPGVLALSWTELSGPGPVAFSNPSSATTSASLNGGAGTYVLQLSANDSLLSASAQVTITLLPQNGAPTVNAGPNQTITLPTTQVTLAGSASDDGLPHPPGMLSVLWTEASGPGGVTFASPSSATTTATFSAPGNYRLRLVASDSALESSSDVVVTVIGSNLPPTVSAGPAQTVALPGGWRSGKIVVANDADFAYASTNLVLLATNAAAWFTGYRPGNFLVWSNDSDMTPASLTSAMHSEGHSWTIVDPSLSGSASLFTAANLARYDGVFLAGNPAIDNQILIDYVSGGGNVFLAGGTGFGSAATEAEQWNPFLNAFNLAFEPKWNNANGLFPVSSLHPVFSTPPIREFRSFIQIRSTETSSSCSTEEVEPERLRLPFRAPLRTTACPVPRERSLSPGRRSADQRLCDSARRPKRSRPRPSGVRGRTCCV